MSTSVRWYVQRLRRMSAQEVLSRAGDRARQARWARRQVRPGDSFPAVPGLLPGRVFASPVPLEAREQVSPDAARSLVATADRILTGQWDVLGTPRPDVADPDWFHDPVTGRRAPDAAYAFAVDHRDETVTGNVKSVWELSRHHHLTVLAAAWWRTSDPRYAEAVAAQLRSWWGANPFLSGIHWTSGIELGVRLTSWVWVRRLLDSWPGVADLFEDNPMALVQIRWHQEYLAAFRSRGSSANNHVVAEAVGRLVAACAFPWFEESDGWRRDAARELHHELAANTFPSGVNREQASDYHRFVTELGLVALVEAEVWGIPCPARSGTCWSARSTRRRRCSTGPAARRVRVTATRAGRLSSTTRTPTRGPSCSAVAPRPSARATGGSRPRPPSPLPCSARWPPMFLSVRGPQSSPRRSTTPACTS